MLVHALIRSRERNEAEGMRGGVVGKERGRERGRRSGGGEEVLGERFVDQAHGRGVLHQPFCSQRILASKNSVYNRF